MPRVLSVFILNIWEARRGGGVDNFFGVIKIKIFAIV